MSLPDVLRKYRPYLPLALSALLVALFAVYLVGRVNEWLALTDTTAAPAGTPQDTQALARPEVEQLQRVFGSPALPAEGASTTAAANLTLHGSFVSADPARSSAIIQIDGQPPRLLFTGDELEQGVTLQQVNANGVQIMRNGRIEQLMFPKSRSPLYAPEPYSEPPANAPDPAAEQMQQQMEALRQKLEQAIDQPQDTPTNDQPMEED